MAIETITTRSICGQLGMIGIIIRCIFGEILIKKPFFEVQEEKEQMERIYQILGPPDDGWEECKEMPYYKELQYF